MDQIVQVSPPQARTRQGGNVGGGQLAEDMHVALGIFHEFRETHTAIPVLVRFLHHVPRVRRGNVWGDGLTVDRKHV